jgi:hypothetical protein
VSPGAPGTTARAAEEHATEPSDGRSGRWQWYGWQIIITDAAALSTLALAAGTSSGETGDHTVSTVLLGLGFSGYLMGGFAVHATHRRWLSAGMSVGLRVVLPLLGAAVGAGLESSQNDPWSGLAGAATGVLVGAGLAHVLDVTALSFVPPAKHPPTTSASNTRAPVLEWYPVIRMAPESRRGSATFLGVGAAF